LLVGQFDGQGFGATHEQLRGVATRCGISVEW
jgi:hypothetical protein